MARKKHVEKLANETAPLPSSLYTKQRLKYIAQRFNEVVGQEEPQGFWRADFMPGAVSPFNKPKKIRLVKPVEEKAKANETPEAVTPEQSVARPVIADEAIAGFARAVLSPEQIFSNASPVLTTDRIKDLLVESGIPLSRIQTERANYTGDSDHSPREYVIITEADFRLFETYMNAKIKSGACER